ncbi:MAG TPA: hypothetical protein VHQ45_16695, partial [Gemmatimonadaceae bacterium]|nr:hypothetical protein [Gemmatimonadaceae bacterium]
MLPLSRFAGRPGRRRPSKLAAALGAAALVFVSGTARSQVAPGAGDDAVVLPRGVIRTTVGGEFRLSTEHFGSGADGAPTSTRGPIDFGLSGPLDASRVPAVGTLQTFAPALTGVTNGTGLSLSLGTAAVRSHVTTARVPIVIEAGLGARLSLSVLVPYVETHNAVRRRMDVTGANLGINPVTGEDAEAALAANGALVTQMQLAGDQLGALVTTCAATPAASPSCVAVNADPARATATSAAALAYADAVAQVYGIESTPGTPFVPLAGSDAQLAVVAQLAALRSQLSSYGVASGAATGPSAAVLPATQPELDAYLADPASQVDVTPIGNAHRYGLGDVEVGGRLLLVDTYGAFERGVEHPRRFALRATVGALVRLPTGKGDDPRQLLDVPTGDGQMDVELSGATDLIFGRGVWLSAVARYGMQLPDEPEVRVPAFAGQVVIPADRLQTVERDLGDYLELELTPRVAINRYFTLTAQYQYRRKGEDSYSATGGSEDDVSALGFGTETYEHRAGVGVTLSTVPAYLDRRANWPADVTYLYRRTVAGGGQLAWQTGQHQV